MRSSGWLLACGLAVALWGGCKPGEQQGAGGPGSSSSASGRLSGEVLVDGSSTVAPITTAVAEEFSKMHQGVRVPVGTSGTGGGFKKFCNGEIDICDASRPIAESELKLCEERNIVPVELKVAIDGLTVAVNPQNDWLKSLSIEELKKIWAADSQVKKWSDINPEYPDESIKLFGPDTDSGTFDYFTEEILGKKGASRSDYQQSADDNFIVTGVASDKYALGYFGYAYYVENTSKLKAVPIAAEGGEPVAPTPETIESGAYTPLSRPLFLYVRTSSLERPETREFLQYYLSEEGRELVTEVGYIPLGEEQYSQQVQKLEEAIAAAGQK